MADENKTTQAITGVMPKLLLALTQIPLFGGAALWWEKIKERPVAAAAIALAYEALLVLAKVWARIEDKAVERTADWLWTGIINFAPVFQRRYKQQIIRDHGVFNVRGLGLLNTYTLKLEEVFVDLRIAPSSNPIGANVDLVTRKEFAGNRPVWEFLRVKRRKNDDALALAVIGPPGCGKTTLLRHVALTLAGNRQQRYRSRAYTPVFLFLRDHVAAITQEKPLAIGALAQQHFSNTSIYSSLKTPAGWFEKQVEQGRCIILLDGLDEIADLQKRRAVAAWIDNQIRNYPDCRFIITARPQGYLDAPLERASVLLEVQPFNAEQVRKFVGGWYLANEIKSAGNEDNAEVRQRAAKGAQDLMRRLRGLPALSALMVNPLLLTMIALVYRFKEPLSGKRVGLYADICEVLLGRWQETKELPDSLSPAQKLVVLRPLAAGMMMRLIRDIKTNEAIALVEPHLKRVGYADRPNVFLDNLEAGSGLFLEREPGLWSFAHLTFQEYLTAAHWLEEKTIACNWSEMVNDSWWHETLRLYAAQGNATSIVQACLDTDTVAALTLAADCLEEAREIEAAVGQAANDRLIADLESSDVARRCLAAEVKLSRRLKSLHSLDEQPAIDETYLTCAEYQLFLDDRRAQRKYHQPDHWTDIKFNAGEGGKPVVGMCAEDARAFCKWLTQRYGGNVVTFRLPSLEEASQLSAPDCLLATWCERGSEFQLTKLTGATEQRLKTHLASITGFTRFPFSLSFFAVSDRARARARALDHALDYALDRTLNRGRAFDLDLDRALARAIDHDLTRDLAQAIDRALDRTLDHAIVRDFARDFARDLARDLARDVDFKLVTDALMSSIRKGELPEAIRLAHSLETDSNVYLARWGRLLSNLLAAAGAETSLAVRQAYRRYVLQLMEYAYLGYEELEKLDRPALGKRFSRRRRVSESLPEFKQIVLELYWWLQIVQAREEGKLPAWEGIRIVCEQVLPAEPIVTNRMK
jgi:Predicted NTPase (NACHT family)